MSLFRGRSIRRASGPDHHRGAATEPGGSSVVESLGAALFDRNPVPMAVVDGAGVLRAANPALARYLGHDQSAVVGTPMHEHGGSAPTSWVQLGTGERRLRHARGHDLWANVSSVALPEIGDGAALVCLHDATSRRKTERMLLHAAMHDSLTDLPNRRLLRDRLDTALVRAARTAARVAVLFVDLDGFKEVNDRFGHAAGDEVLVSVADGILGALRSCDTVARLGGDEFVVVCEDLDGDGDLARLVDRLLAGISHPVEVDGGTVEVSASIGVALAQPDTAGSGELLRQADLAMLQAKAHPELGYVVADADADAVPDSRTEAGPDSDAEADADAVPDRDTDPDAVPDRDTGPAPEPVGGGLTGELRQAISAGLLRLHYQPVVRIDGRLIGLEALLRWDHPRLGLLLPEEFLPRIAGTDLAALLTDWVLREAVHDAAGWGDPGLRVSVNVWAEQVAQPGFAARVDTLLAAAGLPARGLYLELQQQDLPAAGPSLGAEMRALRLLGVGLAIDDPGSGGTPPTGLRRLPVDTVKVSREVVAGCVFDREDGVRVAAVAMAARAAGRHPLAMGVETVEQLRVVEELGYGSIQGHLTGPPAALIDLQDLVATRRVVLPSASRDSPVLGRHT